jgi:hypothetical protein
MSPNLNRRLTLIVIPTRSHISFAIMKLFGFSPDHTPCLLAQERGRESTEVSIIIRLFTSIIVYIDYNIIEIEIEASIIYIDYINYINIYKGVGRGRSHKPGLLLSEDFHDHRQLYRCKRQEANILV